MRYVRSFACAAVIALALVPSQAFAKNDHAKGRPPHAAARGLAHDRPSAVSTSARAALFSVADHTLVRVFFARNPVVWTGLPPGIAKNYARGKPLPPGIAKHMLPPALLAKLPARAGFEYARVGQDVVLIDAATRIVVDLIENIFG